MARTLQLEGFGHSGDVEFWLAGGAGGRQPKCFAQYQKVPAVTFSPPEGCDLLQSFPGG